MSPEEAADDHAVGGELLMSVSNAVVQAQKNFFGKGPVKARSYVLDDLLVVVMRGGYTTAEKTMLECGRGDVVRDFRQAYQNEMAGHLMGTVEGLTGRKVLTYQSQVMFEPDVIVELFVLEGRGDEEVIAATAEGQLQGEPVGEVETNEEP